MRPPAEDPGYAIGRVIKRLKDKTLLPQQLFLEQVEQWREVDQEDWNRQFPEFYRERIAAESLAEVYSSGMTGEQWGRQFLREHGLEDCYAARDIVSGLAAVDTMIMVDKEQGILNKVGVEKLCRRSK